MRKDRKLLELLMLRGLLQEAADRLADVQYDMKDSYLQGYRDGCEKTLKDLVKHKILENYEIQIVENSDTGEGYVEFFATPKVK